MKKIWKFVKKYGGKVLVFLSGVVAVIATSIIMGQYKEAEKKKLIEENEKKEKEIKSDIENKKQEVKKNEKIIGDNADALNGIADGKLPGN